MGKKYGRPWWRRDPWIGRIVAGIFLWVPAWLALGLVVGDREFALASLWVALAPFAIWVGGALAGLAATIEGPWIAVAACFIFGIGLQQDGGVGALVGLGAFAGLRLIGHIVLAVSGD
ncbi:hypothetical protein [Sphingomonas sp. LaA6.9]|uniref:hypothetical protein n=1 Tax=Sphingomonas sp. LaA6.9 TaxID=2919914 RepID=UPI001F503D7C|nr:hypothetical protein [Sphingomonas sp. LaA6.9]MCJ8158833.1 hypothetical protein [Sphingomonas sp. LaA6.9]